MSLMEVVMIGAWMIVLACGPEISALGETVGEIAAAAMIRATKRLLRRLK